MTTCSPSWPTTVCNWACGRLADRPRALAAAGLVVPALSDEDTRTLRCLAGVIEAMLLAFHVEHVAIAAHQIGYARGTGGTSGVEFLLLATFRRVTLVDRGLGPEYADWAATGCSAAVGASIEAPPPALASGPAMPGGRFSQHTQR